ncbi:MAG: hypothetical protein KME47_22800 [Nodosilinea sp. WJT8-NPBG4]|nr:hypothetical protein [Nodosilinea sp. WJT8-NPBG4]
MPRSSALSHPPSRGTRLALPRIALTLDRSLASCPIHERFGQLALDNGDLRL